MRSHGLLVLAMAFFGWVAGTERGAAEALGESTDLATAAGVIEAVATDCDDGNACTIDIADPALGCRWIPSDEGLACDGAGCVGSCSAGECTSTQCDDADPQTASACTPSGCMHVPLATDDAPASTCEHDVELPGFTVVEGAGHWLALDGEGGLFAWGDNAEGQLGTGAVGGHRHRPQAIGRGYRDDARAIAAGTHHSLALRGDGTVAMWGRDDRSATKHGAAIARTVVFANGEPLRDIVAVAAGADVSFALASDGTLWSWGTSGPGRLGDGTRGATHRDTPVQVMRGRGSPLVDVVAIEVDSDHAIALTRGGDVLAWGSRADGGVYATPIADPSPRTRLASR